MKKTDGTFLKVRRGDWTRETNGTCSRCSGTGWYQPPLLQEMKGLVGIHSRNGNV